MAKKNEWKDRVGVVFSTQAGYQFTTGQHQEADTLTPEAQRLRVVLDRSGRAGKTVTLITGFIGKTDDLESLGKMLKTKCSTGGSVKNGEILLQGDVRDQAMAALTRMGYGVKRSG